MFVAARRSTSAPSPSIVAVISELRRSYTCFENTAASQQQQQPPQAVLPRHRTQVGSREISRENLARKDFQSLMNKLSDANHTAICAQLKSVFREDCLDVYVRVLWDMVQRSHGNVERFLKIMDEISGILGECMRDKWAGEWAKLWNLFVTEKQWDPPESLLQGDDYDDFCEYGVWRKRTLSAIKAWCLFHTHDGDTLADSLTLPILEACMGALLKTPSGNKAIDVYLDQLQCAIQTIGRSRLPVRIDDWLQGWTADRLATLRPATRFKVMDMRDALR